MATGTFPTASESSTTLAAMIPEIWSEKMNNFYRDNLKAAAFFTDLSSDLAEGGDIVHVPSGTEMIAHTKTNATAVTLNNPTETTVDLTVTTWKECSFAIEDRETELVKKSYNTQETYAQNCAYTVAAAYEDAILALYPSFSQTVGASTAALADSDIRRAIQYLDEAKAPQTDRAFFLTPKQVWTDVQAIDKFSLLVNTVGADPVLKGHVGYLYGIPVIMSERIGATNGSANSALAHKDAIVHASTIMRVQSNYIPQYLSTVTTADVLYGTVENRDTSGVWIKTADA
jgi:hypothetical protein|tara:strand:+ start:517 stop:1377 length:861 start_codon:yes stop_codon:yes gene_type:complete